MDRICYNLWDVFVIPKRHGSRVIRRHDYKYEPIFFWLHFLNSLLFLSPYGTYVRDFFFAYRLYLYQLHIHTLYRENKQHSSLYHNRVVNDPWQKILKQAEVAHIVCFLRIYILQSGRIAGR